jgi:hypothetical protein
MLHLYLSVAGITLSISYANNVAIKLPYLLKMNMRGIHLKGVTITTISITTITTSNARAFKKFLHPLSVLPNSTASWHMRVIYTSK